MPNGKTQHILFVVNNYPPRLGGLEQHVHQLSKHVVSAGHRATVVALAPESSDGVEDGVRVIRRPMHFPIASVLSFPRPGTTAALARLLTEAGVTVISTHTRFFPMSFVGVRLGRRIGVPVMHTEHGAGFVKSPSRIIATGAKLVDLTMGAYVLRKADAVLAVSREVADFVRALAGRDSELFYNAIEVARWRRPGDPATPPDRLAFLGRLVPGKGWETFLTVARRVAAMPAHTSVRIEIMGDGPDMPSLLAMVEDYGLQQQTTIHGHADAATISASLSGSVLVNASELAEGFQITLLEAAAAGSQIVSYPVPSVEPLLADGAPIRVVQRSPESLLDATVAALENPLPPMTDAALEQWSWRARAEQYLEEAASATDRPRADKGWFGTLWK